MIEDGWKAPYSLVLDAMAAAIAIANDLPLYTANPRDFTGIAGLDVDAGTVPPAAER